MTALNNGVEEPVVKVEPNMELEVVVFVDAKPLKMGTEEGVETVLPKVGAEVVVAAFEVPNKDVLKTGAVLVEIGKLKDVVVPAVELVLAPNTGVAAAEVVPPNSGVEVVPKILADDVVVGVVLNFTSATVGLKNEVPDVVVVVVDPKIEGVVTAVLIELNRGFAAAEDVVVALVIDPKVGTAAVLDTDVPKIEGAVLGTVDVGRENFATVFRLEPNIPLEAVDDTVGFGVRTFVEEVGGAVEFATI